MSKLDKTIRQIQEGYKELRQCENPPIKKAIIGSIRPKCIEALEIIDADGQVPANVSKRKTIESIKSKIDELQSNIDKEEQIDPKIGHGGRKIFLQQEDQRRSGIIKTIVMQEIRTMNIKYSQKEINELLRHMENNIEITNQINKMITKQGGDIDAVEKNIEKTYDNMLIANSELDEAQKEQMHHVQKVRGIISSSFGGVWSFIKKPIKYVFHDAWVKTKK